MDSTALASQDDRGKRTGQKAPSEQTLLLRVGALHLLKVDFFSNAAYGAILSVFDCLYECGLDFSVLE